MTDLTALTEITSPTTDDLVYVVDAPTGAKNPRKCSIANLVASADIDAAKITSGTLPIAQLPTVTIAKGGTGATTDSAARTALGLAIGTNVQAYNSATALTTNRLNDFAAPNAAIALGSQKITGLANGVADTDAATKGQVDAAQAGLDAKDACRVATTANITLSGEQAIDGVTTTTDRVLVKNQSTANQNGIYVSASGAWARSTDADANAEVTSGLYTFITEGTANGSTGFVLTTDDPITVGTTALTFSQFSGLAQLNAGTGITKTGNTINVDVGIANDELPQFTTGAVDDDFLRISGTKIEGLNAGEVLTAIGASPTAGNSSLVTVGALSTGGTITSGFGNIDNGTSTISTGQVDIVAEGNLRLQDATGGQFVAVEAPATVGTSYTVKLPAAIGAAGEALKIATGGISGTIQTMEWGSAGGAVEPLLNAVSLQNSSYVAPTYTSRAINTASEPIQLWVKDIDTNNQGVYMRIKKNGAYKDVQIA